MLANKTTVSRDTTREKSEGDHRARDHRAERLSNIYYGIFFEHDAGEICFCRIFCLTMIEKL